MMSVSPQRVQYVAWHHHQPAYLINVGAVVRWAQSLGLSVATVWRLDDDAQAAVPVMIHRTDAFWQFVAEDGAVLGEMAVDPLDDPLALMIVEELEPLAPIRMVRVEEAQWPPAGAAETDPRGLYWRFGFTTPRLVMGKFEATYSPEVIARQVRLSGLAPIEQHVYVKNMYLRLVWWSANCDVPLEEREKIVDDAMYQTNPESLSLVGRVQMAALGDVEGPDE